MGHFVSFPRKREKTYRRDSKGEEIDGQGRKRKVKKQNNKRPMGNDLLT